jgi:hypothetical protein
LILDVSSSVSTIPLSRATEPSLTPEGWSVRDLVWHLACWNEVVKDELEKMRLGTFDEAFEWATDANNDHLPELRRFSGVNDPS